MNAPSESKMIQLGNGAVALWGTVAITGNPVLAKPANLNTPPVIWTVRLTA